jgi:hypothetical protein
MVTPKGILSEDVLINKTLVRGNVGGAGSRSWTPRQAPAERSTKVKNMRNCFDIKNLYTSKSGEGRFPSYYCITSLFDGTVEIAEEVNHAHDAKLSKVLPRVETLH